ncbi:hypothetical protein K438DRAFT_1938093 [Mycena galopus ATCC 62051]|nr:hypothetical protein K438DRAFT_1938093 [Mycena galopus ATCC 62051]
MTSSSLAGAGLLIIWGSISPTEVDEPTFNDWWTNEHLPERLALPGFLRCRRFVDPATSTAPESKYLVWYEVDDPKALVSPQYMEKLDNPTPRTARFMPLLATLQRLRELFAHATVLAFHVVEQDEETTRAGSQTKSYAGVSQSFQRSGLKCMVLVEFSESIVSPSGQREALKSMVVDWAAEAGSTHVEGTIYGLIRTSVKRAAYAIRGDSSYSIPRKAIRMVRWASGSCAMLPPETDARRFAAAATPQNR